VRIGWSRLLHAVGWAMVPAVLFNVVAVLALGGHVERLASDHVIGPGELPGIVVAVVMSVVGSIWALVSFVNLGAAAAATTRSRVLAAMAIWLTLAAAGASALFFAKQS